MTYFTDSPYERMMIQKPKTAREALAPPALPSDHPCFGCAYGRDSPCMGICYKELMKKRSDKRRIS